MTTELYSACWALQDPALNDFKRFLRLNAEQLRMSGIIYPTKIPDAIEGIAVLDFQEALAKIPAGTPLLDCMHSNATQASALKLRAEVELFSRVHQYPLIPIAQLLRTLIQDDAQNTLQWPMAGVSSDDLRSLLAAPVPALLTGHFLDAESCLVALALDHTLRTAEWERMLAFDKDETPEQSLQETLHLVYQVRGPQRFRILSAPLRFLNALLQFQQVQRDFSIHLHCSLLQGIAPHQLAFYAQSFKGRLHIEETASEDDANTVLLSESAAAITQRIKDDQSTSCAIFGMTRSLLDHHDLCTVLGTRNYRISLRQPDTQFSHLMASLIT